MMVHVAGFGFDLKPGDVTERFEGKEAEAMLSRGYAVPEDHVPVERAVKSAAVEKRPRARRTAA
jgi:hypothetical protein